VKLIETKTLSTAQSSIVFSSIPQNFTDLTLLVSGRTTADSIELRVQFNSDTGSNYTMRRLFGDGGAASATSQSTSTTFLPLYGIAPTSAAANDFGNTILYIPNYAGSTTKSVRHDGVTQDTARGYITISAGLWSGTAAITSITLIGQTGNMAAGSTVSLYGIGGVGDGYAAPKATGGSIMFLDGYWIHSFDASGTFTPTSSLSAEYLVIAGGGGGGSTNPDGGGGAGGYLTGTASFTSGTAYTVTVGAGGAINNSGSTSEINSVSASGGGRGGQYTVNNPAVGGSGGGGAANQSGAAAIPGQGNSGGNGLFGTYDPGGGGGGAGGAGGNSNGTTGGTGGAGLSSSITGVSIARGGGGGGAVAGPIGNRGTATAGGGAGGYSGNAGVAGTANTGGGGGGKAAGGSGIVIVRYPA
jgi:hypothetical protein